MSNMAHTDVRIGALVLSAVVLLCVWMSSSAIAEEDASATSRVAQLSAELEEVREQIKEFHTQVAENERKRWRQQQELEHKDPEAVALRERMVVLEKELVELRRQLNTRLAVIEGVRDLQRGRKKMFKELQNLKQTEEAILRELATARHQAP